MARIILPPTFPAAIGAPRVLSGVSALVLVLLVAGCASLRPDSPIPPELTPAGVSARVLIPADLNVNPPETVVKPDAQGQAPADPPSPPEFGGAPTIFALSDAIAFALRNNPRLRSARAAILRAQGQEQVAFSPFLPQIDLLRQYGVVSSTLAPGIPGNEGFLLPNGTGTRSYAQTEVGLQWTLYDFGRTGGRYRQAVARERITELQLARADQTVEFDVATAYLDVLLARAPAGCKRMPSAGPKRSWKIRWPGASKASRSKTTCCVREVQLSESREALVLAREGEFDAVARLNNAMGRNAGWPLEVVDLESQPPLPGALAELLEHAAAPAAGGRRGPASGGGRPGGPAGGQGRVPAADLRPRGRGAYGRAKT